MLTIWLLRLTWASLPLTAGPAAANASRHWSAAPAVVANVLLWAAWAVVLLGVFAPRPIGLTALRTVAPAFVVLAVWAAPRSSAGGAAAAILATSLAFVLGATGRVGGVCVNGAAYGDERRFPLAVPPALFLGPIPIAVALVAVGIAAGPLLLANGHFVLGAVALGLGAPVAALLSRSLYGLARRWAVLVPAGLVIVDRFTLVDPVLFTRDGIRALRPVDARVIVPPQAQDLRLGAVLHSVRMDLSEPVNVTRARRGRGPAQMLDTQQVLFAPVRAAELLAVAGRRRIRIGERGPTREPR